MADLVHGLFGRCLPGPTTPLMECLVVGWKTDSEI